MSDCVIGIDIGGTNLRLALVSATGEIVARCRLSSMISEGLDAFCNRTLFGIDELRTEALARNQSIAGIGVGVPGLVESSGMIHASVNMRPLDGFNLSTCLAEKTGLYVECINDANAIALGEQQFGAGLGKSSFIVITIGTGLGSGLILDGKLWKGADGFAAEFGHVTVDPDGAVCHCGNHGCLEIYASAGALLRAMDGLFPAESARYRPHTSEDVACMARGGSIEARQAFDQMGRWLGIALASLSNLLNLEAVIFGGGVAASLDLFETALHSELSMRCFPEIYAGLEIMKSKLGDDAGLLGAAALVSGRIRNTEG